MASRKSLLGFYRVLLVISKGLYHPPGPTLTDAFLQSTVNHHALSSNLDEPLACTLACCVENVAPDSRNGNFQASQLAAISVIVADILFITRKGTYTAYWNICNLFCNKSLVL